MTGLRTGAHPQGRPAALHQRHVPDLRPVARHGRQGVRAAAGDAVPLRHPREGLLRADRRGRPALRTFVLFDTLNAFKEKVFAGLTDTVSRRADIDVCFHHFNPGLFRRLLLEARSKYDRYVVMPFPAPEVTEALAALEPERLLVLDIHACVPGKRTAWIVQNFDAQLVEALQSGQERLRRYRRFIAGLPARQPRSGGDPGRLPAIRPAGRLETSIVPRLDRADGAARHRLPGARREGPGEPGEALQCHRAPAGRGRGGPLVQRHAAQGDGGRRHLGRLHRLLRARRPGGPAPARLPDRSTRSSPPVSLLRSSL